MYSIDNDSRFKEWFEQIYASNFEQLFRYAFSITKDKGLAEDVVSEVFTNIWDKKPDHTNIKELRSYLSISVKHLAIRLASKDPQKFTYSNYDETLQISDVIDPENLLLGKELKQVIDSVVAEASPKCQIVYELAKVKGLSFQQIADEMGISKRSAESHMHQVIKKLKNELNRHFDEKDNQRYLFKLGAIGSMLVPSAMLMFL